MPHWVPGAVRRRRSRLAFASSDEPVRKMEALCPSASMCPRVEPGHAHVMVGVPFFVPDAPKESRSEIG